MSDMLKLVACLFNPAPVVDSGGQVFDTRQAEAYRTRTITQELLASPLQALGLLVRHRRRKQIHALVQVFAD